MSLWTDRTVKELMARVSELERNVNEFLNLDVPEGKDPRTSMYMDELIHDYTKKFGKKPHHFMKPESIREALK